MSTSIYVHTSPIEVYLLVIVVAVVTTTCLVYLILHDDRELSPNIKMDFFLEDKNFVFPVSS